MVWRDEMKVLLSGASGLIGTALRRTLSASGTEVISMVRPDGSGTGVSWDPDHHSIDTAALRAQGPYNAVIHLAGFGIGERRWNGAVKDRIYRSRVTGTKLLVDSLVEHDVAPEVFIGASATGYYGDRGDEVVNEDSGSGEGFLATVCRDWEAASAAIGVRSRLVHLRTGVVLSGRGGALTKQLPLFKLGLGGRLGRGDQWLPWIHIDDEVRVIERIIEDSTLRGALNATAPNSVTNAEFTNQLGSLLKRPTVVPAPRFALELALGPEMAKELLLSSARVQPARLLSAHFEFAFPTVEAALDSIIG